MISHSCKENRTSMRFLNIFPIVVDTVAPSPPPSLPQIYTRIYISCWFDAGYQDHRTTEIYMWILLVVFLTPEARILRTIYVYIYIVYGWPWI